MYQICNNVKMYQICRNVEYQFKDAKFKFFWQFYIKYETKLGYIILFLCKLLMKLNLILILQWHHSIISEIS